MATKITWIFLLLGIMMGVSGLAQPKGEKPAPTILFLVAEGYNCDEFWPPWLVFQAAGFRVVMASPEGGPVRAGHSDRSLDVAYSERLDTLTLTRFSGLFLVGGHSPENLERYPAALTGCRHFFETPKPVAAICHGPRLLEKAGLLRAKAGTLYFGIKEEVPQRWVSSGFGLRYDRPWVRDGNLLTSRYPLDVAPFLTECLSHFSAPSFSRKSQRKRRVWVWGEGLSVRERYLFRSAVFDPLGFDLLLAGPGKPLRAQAGDRILIPHPETVPDSVLDILRKGNRTGIPVRYFPNPQPPSRDFSMFEKLPMPLDSGLIGAFQSWNLEPVREESAYSPAWNDTLWILLDHGFDEETVLGLQALGRIYQKEVRLVGETLTLYTGLNGLGVKAEYAFSGWTTGKPGIWVAPGCLWPDFLSSKARVEWIRNQIFAGSRVWVGGYDVLSVFRHPNFTGWRVAAPDPARWEFQKTAVFVEDQVFLPRPHVLTFKGPQALPDLHQRLLKGIKP